LSAPVLEAIDLVKTYVMGETEVRALRGVSVRIARGEFVAVRGPSGSGKSTFMNIAGCLDRPTSGRFVLDGIDVSTLSRDRLAEIRNREIGFVFQTFHLVSDLTVLDNVQIPLLYRSLSNRERKRRALAALDRVGLSARVHHFPSQLSGGQQQRVAIARAIVGAPRILLADEPTGNLDSQMGDEIMALLRDLNEQERTTVVMVTHDQQKAEQTHRIVRLFDGRQVQ
jgi:putative ABC transport system ATP-binding protein